jgi:hypothetical protein
LKIILATPEKYYPNYEWIIPFVQNLSSDKLTSEEIIKQIIDLIKKINK